MNRLSAICLALIVMSGLSLVSSQYRARQLFIDLESARAAMRKLDIEWRTLQLDQTNYSKHSLIVAAARRDLHMQPATPARTQYIVLTQRRGSTVDTSKDLSKDIAKDIAKDEASAASAGDAKAAP